MKDNQTIIQTARRLKNLQSKLNPLVFDTDGIMHDEIREHFLKIAQFLIDKNISQLPNIEITDIVLVGSSASYMYYEKSDFDVKIFVKVNDAPWMENSEEAKIKFQALFGATLFNHTKFYLKGRLVDIKLGNGFYDKTGNYSIKNNNWISQPYYSPELTQTPNEYILNHFYQKRAALYDALAQMHSIDGKYSLADCKAIGQIYAEISTTKPYTTGELEETMPNFLAYKLLSASGMFGEFKNIAIQALNDSLSLQ